MTAAMLYIFCNKTNTNSSKESRSECVPDAHSVCDWRSWSIPDSVWGGTPGSHSAVPHSPPDRWPCLVAGPPRRPSSGSRTGTSCRWCSRVGEDRRCAASGMWWYPLSPMPAWGQMYLKKWFLWLSGLLGYWLWSCQDYDLVAFCISCANLFSCWPG